MCRFRAGASGLCPRDPLAEIRSKFPLPAGSQSCSNRLFFQPTWTITPSKGAAPDISLRGAAPGSASRPPRGSFTLNQEGYRYIFVSAKKRRLVSVGVMLLTECSSGPSLPGGCGLLPHRAAPTRSGSRQGWSVAATPTRTVP